MKSAAILPAWYRDKAPFLIEWIQAIRSNRLKCKKKWTRNTDSLTWKRKTNTGWGCTYQRRHRLPGLLHQPGPNQTYYSTQWLDWWNAICFIRFYFPESCTWYSDFTMKRVKLINKRCANFILIEARRDNNESGRMKISEWKRYQNLFFNQSSNSTIPWAGAVGKQLSRNCFRWIPKTQGIPGTGKKFRIFCPGKPKKGSDMLGLYIYIYRGSGKF